MGSTGAVAQGDLFADPSTGVEVHHPKEVTSDRGKKRIVTNCGRVILSKDWPPEASVWGSDITCTKCLTKG